MLTALQIVRRLLETDLNPYNVDDPLEKPSEEELKASREAKASALVCRLLVRSEQVDKIKAAAEELSRRKSRRSNPDGYFDSAGRWYPSSSERQSCCAGMSPTRNWPYTVMLHCRTLVHVANLFGVDRKSLRSYMRHGIIT